MAAFVKTRSGDLACPHKTKPPHPATCPPPTHSHECIHKLPVSLPHRRKKAARGCVCKNAVRRPRSPPKDQATSPGHLPAPNAFSRMHPQASSLPPHTAAKAARGCVCKNAVRRPRLPHKTKPPHPVTCSPPTHSHECIHELPASPPTPPQKQLVAAFVKTRSGDLTRPTRPSHPTRPLARPQRILTNASTSLPPTPPQTQLVAAFVKTRSGDLACPTRPSHLTWPLARLQRILTNASTSFQLALPHRRKSSS